MHIEIEKLERIAFPSGILDLALSKDGRVAYVACMDGIYACALANSESPVEGASVPTCIGRHGSYVSSIAVLQDRSTLASSSYDGTVQLRDLPNELGLRELAPRVTRKAHSFWSWDMAASPDQRWLASVTGQYQAGAEDYTPKASEEPTVRILDAATGDVVHSFEMLPSVQCVAFDSSSQWIAAANLMGDVSVWSVLTGERLAHWRTPSFTSWGIIKSHCFIGGIYALAFSPDSESLYVAGMGDMKDPMAGNGKQLWQRFAWRKPTHEKLQETKTDQSGEGLMEALAFHPGGEHFVMAGRLRGGNWNAGFFETETGQLVGQAKTGMRITTARYSSDGNSLILAGMQGQPEPKKSPEVSFPAYGYLERYRVKIA